MQEPKVTDELRSQVVERYVAWKPGIDTESFLDIAHEFGISRATLNRVIRESGVARKRGGNGGDPQASQVLNMAEGIANYIVRAQQAEARVQMLEAFIRANKLKVPR